MDIHKDRLRAGAIGNITAYFQTIEDFDSEIEQIISEARSAVAEKQERKERYATKEWLNEYWASLPWNKEGTRLEDEEWFIRWLDEVNLFGNQRFLKRCRGCDGAKTILNIVGTAEFKCPNCKGTGEEVGPNYCRRCNQLFATCGASCSGRAHY